MFLSGLEDDESDMLGAEDLRRLGHCIHWTGACEVVVVEPCLNRGIRVALNSPWVTWLRMVPDV